MAENFSREDILRSAWLFHEPGDVLELRIPKAGKYGTISGYFDKPAAFADAVVGLADVGFTGYYFTINPVKPDLLVRSVNKYEKWAENTTSDSDILCRSWLPIDLDPVRPAGISSSEEEHAAALQRAADIEEWLISRGWPAGAFIRADSGNGGHLAARIDLPNDNAARDLIKHCLEALDFIFSDENVKVDTSTFNAARIWKIYGTMAKKGSDTPDRPHRLAKIIDAPEMAETVSREQLEALVAILPKAEPIKSSNGQTFDPVKYAEEHGAHVTRTKNWNGWQIAILDECPFDSSHSRGEACLMVHQSGARKFSCKHDSCKDNDWQALKARWGSPGEAREEETEAERIRRKHAEANPPYLRADADRFETEHPGCKIFNCDDDKKQNEISEDDLNSYSLPEGPKFKCYLPNDHFIQRFMAYGSDISDAYMEYWFAGGLFALAVVADKKIMVKLRTGPVYTNLYISINGKSSLARKSTAVDKSEETLCGVLPSLYPSLVPTEFSPEAFTEHMSDHNHAPWIRDEAAGVLSLMKRDYMRGFKDSLMQLFDCKPFYRKLRTSQRKGTKMEFRVDDPYLNLLWATTDASLGANTEQNDTLSGFMARFLFFFPQGKKSKWLPLEEGTAANSAFEGMVRGQLASIAAKIAELPECTAMHLSKEGAVYYTEWQRVREEEWTASNDGNAMQIYSRLAPTVVKLAMLFELGSPDFDVSMPIRPEFMEEACRLVDSYFMPTARAVYELVGSNAEKNVIDRIIAYLKKHGGKSTKNEILRDMKIKSGDFNEYLATMIESSTVETKTVKRGGKGRDTLYVFLLDQSNVGNVAKVAKIAKIAKVEEIPSENEEGTNSILATLATLATLDTQPTTATIGDGCDRERTSSPTIGPHPRKEDPGFTQFKAGMKKRTCRMCGEHFSYDLGIHYNGGYICARCHREGKPLEPAKPDSQTKLEQAGTA